jgi:hypothetical protein
MRAIVAIAALAVFALPAAAQIQCCYSWEDGGTVLGTYGANAVDCTNVTGLQVGVQGTAGGVTVAGAYDGDYYLHVAEDPHSGTPQYFLAWVTGLTDGDQVTASFFGYDNTLGGSPSLRIWGSYTLVAGDVNSYGGSADGSAEYTSAADGWDQVPDVPYIWTFDSDLGSRDGLVIQARAYSTPSTDPTQRTDFFIDYICVTAPTTACIHFPLAPSPVEDSSWTVIKSLYR